MSDLKLRREIVGVFSTDCAENRLSVEKERIYFSTDDMNSGISVEKKGQWFSTEHMQYDCSVEKKRATEEKISKVFPQNH